MTEQTIDPTRPAPEPEDSFAPGHLIRDRFLIQRELGRGGMSTVYLARDRLREEAGDPDPYVAVKVLQSRHLPPEAVIGLQREASRTQRLAHPNIATVFDFDRDGDVVYLVMEYLSGRALDEVIRQNPGGLGQTAAQRVIAGMAAGLAHAHQHGIVHRDFKPSNVFVLDDGRVKVFDFGIAVATTGHDPFALSAMTPSYASEEVVAGVSPDVRDDVFSFGITVYELLTGNHPFERRAAAAARAERLAPARPHGLTRRQWASLKAALSFEREQRPSDVDAVAAPFIHHTTGSVGRLVARLRQFARRFFRPSQGFTSPDSRRPAGRGSWVADHPITHPDDDRLHYIDYASAIAAVIDSPEIHPPLTLAINGRFGAGKSSVALLVEHLVCHKPEDANEKPHTSSWFHISRYRGNEDIRGAFVRDLVRDLYNRLPLVTRLRWWLPNSFLLASEVRRRRLTALTALLAIGMVGAWSAGPVARNFEVLPDTGFLAMDTVIGAASTALLAALMWLNLVAGPLKSLSAYVAPSEDTRRASEHHQARTELRKLIDRVTLPGSRFVLFVDDLERSPERTMDVLDIIEGLLALPNAVVVMPTDLDVLAEAVASAHHSGWAYLEKYVQLRFDMPAVESGTLFAMLDDNSYEPRSATRPTVDTMLGANTIAGVRKSIDSEIERHGVTKTVWNRDYIPATQWNLLVDERKQRALSNSELFSKAFSTAVSLAGRDIRGAKRIHNHVRLYVSVLFQRKLLSSDSRLSPEQVGKWVALRERWPLVVKTVIIYPALLRRLEAISTTPGSDSLNALRQSIASESADKVGPLLDTIKAMSDSDLDDLMKLLTAQPLIGDVADLLCYMREGQRPAA